MQKIALGFIGMAANCVTVSRILFSVALLGFSPSSALFAALYLLCGVSDVLDGFLARRLHTQSEKGAMLDSIADLFFAAAYAIKVLPLLHLPVWVWIWTALIAIVKMLGIINASRKERRFCIAHSRANKLTGLMLFLLPLTVRVLDVRYSAAAVCAAASLAAAEEWPVYPHRAYHTSEERSIEK